MMAAAWTSSQPWSLRYRYILSSSVPRLAVLLAPAAWLPNSTMPSDEARTTPMNRRQPSESRDVSRATLFLHALMERSFCLPLRPLKIFREMLPPTARPAFFPREACLSATFLFLRRERLR